MHRFNKKGGNGKCCVSQFCNGVKFMTCCSSLLVDYIERRPSSLNLLDGSTMFLSLLAANQFGLDGWPSDRPIPLALLLDTP
jgi:hypothetical protein